ncbi:ribosomal protein L14 [Oratosquilla oratoria]|uniref:ribosomal protein L14 n=1 Tax=Oratosquilla oratoria TaxID=337810 RepID=UPI003F76D00C
MPFLKFVEVGRVAYLAGGPSEGKLAVIVDIINGTSALIDGPCSGVPRQEYKFSNMHLTKFTVKIHNGQHSKFVKKAWNDANISEKWEASNWAKNIEARAKRASLTDYDRFKLGKAKQARNRIITQAFLRLRAKAKKAKAGESK